MVVKNAKLPPPAHRYTVIAVRILAVLSGLIVAASLALWVSWIREIEAESGYHTARALLYLSSISFGVLGTVLAAVGIFLSRCRSPWPWLKLIANCLVAVIIFRYTTWPRASEVMGAVKARDITKIERYARMGVDLNAPSYWGWSHSKGRTPLTQAVEYGDAAMVRALLEAGALVNRVDGHGDAPLNVAVLISRIDIIDLLLKHRADINQSRPLVTALRFGRLKLVPILLAKGAEVPDDALFIALANDDVLLKAWGLDESKVIPTIRELAAHGADLKRKDQNGRTPLTLAIHLHRKAYVQVLVECGAEGNGEDDNSPFSAALQYGELPAAEALLEAGADINQETQSRPTGPWTQPIAWALNGSVRHMRPDILRFALDHGAKPARLNLTDNRNSPLAGAVGSNAKDLVVMLLDAGADPNEKHQDWSSPLRVAIERGNFEMVKLLVKRGADVNRSGDTRKTLLAIAKSKKEPEIEEFLRQNGAK